MAITGFDDRNILSTFFVAYEDTFAGSWANELGLPVMSDRAIEEFGIIGANPGMREWIGPRLAQVLNKSDYEIRNKPYESTLVIPESSLQRDKTGMLQRRISSFASDAGADHWQELLVALINADGVCYDGQNFFDTDHSEGDSGTQTNELTATEVPSANVASATAPTPTEMANVILEQTAHMLTFKNDKGRPVNGQARRFHIQVATAPLLSATVQAISGGLLTGNVDNPLKGWQMGGFTYTVSLETRLTSSTDVIRMYRTDGPMKPFILQDEKALEYDFLGKGSDFYFDNKAYKLGVDARRAVGYGLWQFASKLTLS